MVAWSDEARDAWIDEYKRTFSKVGACESTGIPWETAARWYAEDTEWAARVDSARRQIGDVVQAVLVDRAINGVPQPMVDRQGKPVLDEDGNPRVSRRFSDKLLIAAAENLAGWGRRDAALEAPPRKEIILLDGDGKAMSLQALLEGRFRKLERKKRYLAKKAGNKHQGNGGAQAPREVELEEGTDGT